MITQARPHATVSAAVDVRRLCMSPRLDLSRRRLLGLGAVGAAALLTGCGPRGDRSAAASEEMVDVDYLDFSGRVPADPQRVVVIEGRADLEFALEVGYPVIASGFYFGREGALFEELGQMVPADLETFEFADSNEADFEKIATLEPDLIVMRQNAYTADFYGNARLGEIAPILAVETGMPGWQDVMRDQALQLGRAEQVSGEIQRYRDLIAEIRARSGDRLAEMRLIWGTATQEAGLLVIVNSLGNEVAADLGIDVPLFDPQEIEESYYEVSAENLDRVADANTLAIFAFDERPALGESAAFQRLPAVQAGRVFSFDLTLNQGLARAACAIARRLEEMAAE